MSSVSLCLAVVADGAVYVLGPMLILLAMTIAGGLTYCFFDVVLDLIAPPEGGMFARACHILVVCFFLWNVLHNYFMCVTTPNKGPNYDRVVRELAEATNFAYPETEEQVEGFRRDFEQIILERARARRNGGRPPPRPPSLPASSSSTPSAPPTAGGGSAAATARADGDEEEGGRAAADVVGNGSSDGSASGVGGVANGGSAAAATPMAGSASGASSSLTTTGIHVRPTAASSSPLSRGGDGGGSGSSSSSSSGGYDGPIYRWMLMGPQEWGFCNHSNQPKPPRSHYDHVTKCLVLNMDHYCPWMFNTVGYFNYRYFCNFLLYVFLGMAYGTCITYLPFRNMNNHLYSEQVKLSRSQGYGKVRHLLSYVPTPDERTAVALSFMLCLSVGLAVLCLMGFHAYLVFTAQTTVEFHGNCAKRRRARKRGSTWRNPYDVGWKRNFQQIYGSSLHPLRALLPSRREPEFLPLPVGGRPVLRRRRRSTAKGGSGSRVAADEGVGGRGRSGAASSVLRV